MTMAYVCWEGWFENAELICVFTDETRAIAWQAAQPKNENRFYEAAPLDPD